MSEEGIIYYIGPKGYRKLEQENKQLKEDYNKVIHESTEFESKVYELQDKLDLYKSVIDEVREELSYMSTDCYVEDYDIKDKHYEMLMKIIDKVKVKE